jgi:hypothetical protein
VTKNESHFAFVPISDIVEGRWDPGGEAALRPDDARLKLITPAVDGELFLGFADVRHEYLDRVWNAVDLVRKLKEYEDYYNSYRVHRSLGGTTPAQCAGASSAAPASLDRHAWRQHCRGLFQTPIAA